MSIESITNITPAIEYRQKHSSPSMEDTITDNAEQALKENGEYRPDFSDGKRMQQIRVNLALRGIFSDITPLHRRGDESPVTYRLNAKSLVSESSNVYNLEDYR